MSEWRVGAEYDAEYLRRESGVLRRWLFNHRNESPIRAGLIWCRRRDLNPHGLRHTPLKRACLPFHHFGTWQELEKPPQLRSRVAQTLNIQKRTPRMSESLEELFRSPRSSYRANGSHEVRTVPPRTFACCGLVAGILEAPTKGNAQIDCHVVSCLRFTLYERRATEGAAL